MKEPYGNEVFLEIKARDEWGSFFSYSQYQKLKREPDPVVVVAMAVENGYKQLNPSMSPSDLVDSLVVQGSEIAERKEFLFRALMTLLFLFDPVTSLGYGLMDLLDRRLRERENKASREKSREH